METLPPRHDKHSLVLCLHELIEHERYCKHPVQASVVRPHDDRLSERTKTNLQFSCIGRSGVAWDLWWLVMSGVDGGMRGSFGAEA